MRNVLAAGFWRIQSVERPESCAAQPVSAYFKIPAFVVKMATSLKGVNPVSGTALHGCEARKMRKDAIKGEGAVAGLRPAPSSLYQSTPVYVKIIADSI
jgi:hypothetical protein